MAWVIGNQLHLSCTLQFDGACIGNPGPAGAGAVIRSQDGRMIYRLREGVGYATNNVAEYRALILGLSQAYMNGYKHVHVQGDSLLVCNQVRGLWRVNSLVPLFNEVIRLRNMFHSFSINYVPMEYNIAADHQANLAIHLGLGDGVIQEEREWAW